MTPITKLLCSLVLYYMMGTYLALMISMHVDMAPIDGEMLPCSRETESRHDPFSVKAMKLIRHNSWPPPKKISSL